MDKEKLAKLQAQSTRIGGKTTLRRKVVKKSASTQQSSDIKLQAALKKLGVAPIAGVEEVNMFKEDGNVLHFQQPRVNAALPSNTLAIHGVGQTKELTELVPGILNQLGPDSLASLRKLAESYQSLTARNAADKKEGAEDDDEIPDLVESFDDAEGAEEKKLDDVE